VCSSFSDQRNRRDERWNLWIMKGRLDSAGKHEESMKRNDDSLLPMPDLHRSAAHRSPRVAPRQRQLANLLHDHECQQPKIVAARN
jgi:hypothetical protein